MDTKEIISIIEINEMERIYRQQQLTARQVGEEVKEILEEMVRDTYAYCSAPLQTPLITDLKTPLESIIGSIRLIENNVSNRVGKTPVDEETKSKRVENAYANEARRRDEVYQYDKAAEESRGAWGGVEYLRPIADILAKAQTANSTENAEAFSQGGALILNSMVVDPQQLSTSLQSVLDKFEANSQTKEQE